MVLMLHSNILHHAKEGIPQIGNALFFIVRRIGMTKPPVKLGVGKNS